jgi:hypothetical protein
VLQAAGQKPLTDFPKTVKHPLAAISARRPSGVLSSSGRAGACRFPLFDPFEKSAPCRGWPCAFVTRLFSGIAIPKISFDLNVIVPSFAAFSLMLTNLIDQKESTLG